MKIKIILWIGVSVLTLYAVKVFNSEALNSHQQKLSKASPKNPNHHKNQYTKNQQTVTAQAQPVNKPVAKQPVSSANQTEEWLTGTFSQTDALSKTLKSSGMLADEAEQLAKAVTDANIDHETRLQAADNLTLDDYLAENSPDYGIAGDSAPIDELGMAQELSQSGLPKDEVTQLVNAIKASNDSALTLGENH